MPYKPPRIISQHLRSACCDAPLLQVPMFVTLTHPTFCNKCLTMVAQPTDEDLERMADGDLPQGVVSNEDMDRFIQGFTAALKSAANAFMLMGENPEKRWNDNLAVFKAQLRFEEALKDRVRSQDAQRFLFGEWT